MTWQEYQEAVALLYEQLEGVGTVFRNQRIPDRITGQPRQIDALLKIDAKGHGVCIVVDAKFHAQPIDVKTVEEVAALAHSIGANKSVIVAANGWTGPAEKKAEFLFCDLRLLSLEDALELVVPDKWMLCPACAKDCIVMDQDGGTQDTNGMWLWWLAGACRECHHVIIWCQECGIQYPLNPGEETTCDCGHRWANRDGVLGLTLQTDVSGE
jgi:hypothetical protein